MTAIDLHFDSVGEGPDVVILHGLFGMGRNWAGIARGLSESHRVLTVDLRNHGTSPWADEMTYEAMAEDVAQLIKTHATVPVSLIGHSMGGKTAMTLALTQPDLLARICIVDIAPVPYDHDFEGHLMAMSNLDVASLTRRSEAEAALLAELDDIFLARFLIRNLKTDAAGHFEWGVNLGALAEHIDDITGFPIFEADDAFEGRALFIAGGESDYIQPYHQAEIERLFPEAETEVIPDTGHWVHADKPDVVTARLADFLAA